MTQTQGSKKNSRPCLDYAPLPPESTALFGVTLISLKSQVYGKGIKFKHEWEAKEALRLGSFGLRQFGICDYFFEFQDQKSFHIEYKLLGEFQRMYDEPETTCFLSTKVSNIPFSHE